MDVSYTFLPNWDSWLVNFRSISTSSLIGLDEGSTTIICCFFIQQSAHFLTTRRKHGDPWEFKHRFINTYDRSITGKWILYHYDTYPCTFQTVWYIPRYIVIVQCQYYSCFSGYWIPVRIAGSKTLTIGLIWWYTLVTEFEVRDTLCQVSDFLRK